MSTADDEASSLDGGLTFTRDGADLVFRSPRDHITARFARLHQERRGLLGELTITEDLAPRRLNWGTLDLASHTSRKSYAAELKKDPITASGDLTFEWEPWLHHLCYLAAVAYRTGDAQTVLVGTGDNAADLDDDFDAEPFALKGEQNLLFANSGVGKGYVATALLLQITGAGSILPGVGLPASTRPGLYCDWDWSSREAHRRARAICRGAGVPDHAFFYRRMSGPLTDHADTLATFIRHEGIGTLVIDGLQMACGTAPADGDPSANYQRASEVLRAFGVTVLSIDHPAKGAERGSETPYGSRYKLALCRNIWIARKSYADQQTLHVGLWHDPNSNIPHYPPRGFRLTFDRASWPTGPLRALTFHAEDPGSVPDFGDLLTDWQKIERALKDCPGSPRDLHERSGVPEATTRTRLNERRGKQTFKLPDGRWALIDQQHQP